MRSAVLAIALLLTGCASAVEAPPPVVQPDKLLEDVRILSADDMEGRRTGTPGAARARAYLVQRLEEIGVEDHPDYHKPTDDFAAIPQDFFRRSAQTVLDAVRGFDAELDAIAKEAGR